MIVNDLHNNCTRSAKQKRDDKNREAPLVFP